MAEPSNPLPYSTSYLKQRSQSTSQYSMNRFLSEFDHLQALLGTGESQPRSRAPTQPTKDWEPRGTHGAESPVQNSSAQVS
jgi:hypothetical protein